MQIPPVSNLPVKDDACNRAIRLRDLQESAIAQNLLWLDHGSCASAFHDYFQQHSAYLFVVQPLQNLSGPIYALQYHDSDIYSLSNVNPSRTGLCDAKLRLELKEKELELSWQVPYDCGAGNYDACEYKRTMDHPVALEACLVAPRNTSIAWAVDMVPGFLLAVNAGSSLIIFVIIVLLRNRNLEPLITVGDAMGYFMADPSILGITRNSEEHGNQ